MRTKKIRAVVSIEIPKTPASITIGWLNSQTWKMTPGMAYELSDFGLLRRPNVEVKVCNYQPGLVYMPVSNKEDTRFVHYRLYEENARKSVRYHVDSLFNLVFGTKAPAYLFDYDFVFSMSKRCARYNAIAVASRERKTANKGMTDLGLSKRKCHDCGRPTTDYRCPVCRAGKYGRAEYGDEEPDYI